MFEFDCDTDRSKGRANLKGETGAQMAGMVIRITFLGGATYEGALEADPTSTVPRSATGF